MYYAATAQYINYCLDYLHQQKNNLVNGLRQWLGPAPENYWLLDDGRVRPTTYKLPHSVAKAAYLYDCETRQLFGENIGNGRPRRATPYLSVVIHQPDQDPLDLSDWINELKVQPPPATPFVLPQLVDLWAAVHYTYIGTRYRIEYINSEGMPGSLMIA